MRWTCFLGFCVHRWFARKNLLQGIQQTNKTAALQVTSEH